MSQHTSRQIRLLVVGLVVIAGILMIAVLPFITDGMLNPIISGQLERIEKFTAEGNPQAPLLVLTTWLVSFFYPFWTALSFVGGLALLAVAKPLYEGKPWARGVALLALAMPSMGGAYMIVPWMNFVGSKQGGFPPAVIIMSVGLIPYFAILLADRGDWMQKGVDFAVFMMLGVTAAENFANGHAAFRVLYGHPMRPMFAEDISVLWLSWPVLWIAWIFLMIAIYEFAVRKESAVYYTLIAGAATVIASGATQTVRTATYDYLYGALMGLSLVVLMLVPVVKQRLLKPYNSED